MQSTDHFCEVQIRQKPMEKTELKKILFKDFKDMSKLEVIVFKKKRNSSLNKLTYLHSWHIPVGDFW